MDNGKKFILTANPREITILNANDFAKIQDIDSTKSLCENNNIKQDCYIHNASLEYKTNIGTLNAKTQWRSDDDPHHSLTLSDENNHPYKHFHTYINLKLKELMKVRSPYHKKIKFGLLAQDTKLYKDHLRKNPNLIYIWGANITNIHDGTGGGQAIPVDKLRKAGFKKHFYGLVSTPLNEQIHKIGNEHGDKIRQYTANNNAGKIPSYYGIGGGDPAGNPAGDPVDDTPTIENITKLIKFKLKQKWDENQLKLLLTGTYSRFIDKKDEVINGWTDDHSKRYIDCLRADKETHITKDEGHGLTEDHKIKGKSQEEVIKIIMKYKDKIKGEFYSYPIDWQDDGIIAALEIYYNIKLATNSCIEDKSILINNFNDFKRQLDSNKFIRNLQWQANSCWLESMLLALFVLKNIKAELFLKSQKNKKDNFIHKFLESNENISLIEKYETDLVNLCKKNTKLYEASLCNSANENYIFKLGGNGQIAKLLLSQISDTYKSINSSCKVTKDADISNGSLNDNTAKLTMDDFYIKVSCFAKSKEKTSMDDFQINNYRLIIAACDLVNDDGTQKNHYYNIFMYTEIKGYKIDILNGSRDTIDGKENILKELKSADILVYAHKDYVPRIYTDEEYDALIKGGAGADEGDGDGEDAIPWDMVA